MIGSVALLAAAGTVAFLCALASCGAEPGPQPTAQLRVEPGHPWTPPFGLDRVGRPLDAVVELPAAPAPGAEHIVVGHRDGAEVSRQPLSFARTGNMARVALDAWPTEVALWVKTHAQADAVEVARAEVEPPAFEAEAAALPDRIIHPVDLGTIFVPADWLLLAGGQSATVEVAALARTDDTPGARVVAWYASAPDERVAAAIPLTRGRKAQVALNMGPGPAAIEKDSLHVAIWDAAGDELWHKAIQVVVVPEAPRWPSFGAVATKLRYDAPVPVNGGPSVPYDGAWGPELDDVVVSFPNGARFVFWRGSSYCPFWAGRSNTGLCYEWAEILTGDHMVGRRDCVEPLQDKELRYGRVTIVESTPARAHVRWDYQSCDMDYRVWGEHATEDFYFYPDGFGTRVMTLTAHPGIEVETNEFIIFTPQSGYPFDCLPDNLIDVLWADGKAEFRFPCFVDEQQDEWARLAMRPDDVPALYRIRIGKSDSLAAIHHSPLGSAPDLPGFAPFHDQGALVTPMYWGHHWPLSRGYPTAYSISDRIHETPAHNSSIHDGNPEPLRTETVEAPSDSGRTGALERRTWVWLVGMTDAGDDELRHWAQSFAQPPKIELQGATPAAQPYAIERRALCLTVDKKTIEVAITPSGWCVNPVLELTGAPQTLRAVQQDGGALDPDQYRWDGGTLWLNVSLDRPTTFRLEFAEGAGTQHSHSRTR